MHRKLEAMIYLETLWKPSRVSSAFRKGPSPRVIASFRGRPTMEPEPHPKSKLVQ